MLKEWTIGNFKSFRGQTSLKFSGVTVLAGANSSGKSTIIQSILLIKQTLQYAQGTRAIALNGPLLKLGTVDDVLNAKSRENEFNIGWSLDLSGFEDNPGALIGYGQPFYLRRTSFGVVSTEFSWESPRGASDNDPVNELSKLQPYLSTASLSFDEADEEGEENVRRVIKYSREGDGAELISDPTRKMERTYPWSIDWVDDLTRQEICGDKPSPEVVGITLRHFLPAQAGVRFDQAQYEAQRRSEALAGERSSYKWRDIDNTVVPSELIKLLASRFSELEDNGAQLKLFQERFPLDEGVAYTIQQVREAINDIQRRMRYRSIRVTPERRSQSLALTELIPTFERAFQNQSKGKKFVVEPAYPRTILEAGETIRMYFSNAVRYLGPLRDEPKPIYPLEALANPTEVGYRGEHTAAVLDLHRDRLVTYIPPGSVVGARAFTESKTLHDAVVEWLSYVGVASEVTTADRGVFGHQLQVKTEGVARFHDLTNVGVGVSQILPIIVSSLLAPVGSFLIFEQPELHLHPKVQARLADFFFSVALSGRQCLLETHSEYMIDRFRLRIAQSDGDELSSKIKIYFTDKTEGETNCKPVLVTEYGAIPDWPKDFFDQSQEEVENILKAAIEKRKQQQGKSEQR